MTSPIRCYFQKENIYTLAIRSNITLFFKERSWLSTVRGQIRPAAYFCKHFFFFGMQPHSFTYYLRLQLNICNRDQMAHKALNIYYLALP